MSSALWLEPKKLSALSAPCLICYSRLRAPNQPSAHRFRLSLSWSRLQPHNASHFDEAALSHYRSWLLALRAATIEPMVTLPRW